MQTKCHLGIKDVLSRKFTRHFCKFSTSRKLGHLIDFNWNEAGNWTTNQSIRSFRFQRQFALDRRGVDMAATFTAGGLHKRDDSEKGRDCSRFTHQSTIWTVYEGISFQRPQNGGRGGEGGVVPVNYPCSFLIFKTYFLITSLLPLHMHPYTHFGILHRSTPSPFLIYLKNSLGFLKLYNEVYQNSPPPRVRGG